MSRLFRASILLLLLAACGGGGNFSAPRDLDNACSIVEERPRYYSAMKDAERKWGVPIHVQMAAIHQESKFIGNARTRTSLPWHHPMGRQSSAYGYSQALDGTWEEYQKDQRQRGARRDRIDDATDFMGWYMVGSYERWASRCRTRATSTSPITRGARASRGKATRTSPGSWTWRRTWRNGRDVPVPACQLRHAVSRQRAA